MRMRLRWPPLLCLTVLCSGLACAADAPVELPLTGAAYQIANQAYAAYARRDYRTAVTQAREAVRLRPDLPRLRTLLRKAQNALAASQRSGAGGKSSIQSASLKGAPPGGPAWKLGDAAYKDYDAGRYAEAVEHARQSLRLQPGNPDLHSLLIYALERQQRIDEAAHEADTALRLAPGDPKLQALHDRMHRLLAPAPAQAAWNAYRAGEYARAATLARQAIREAPDVPSYRYLLTGALLREGEYAQADAAATDALAQDGDDALSLAMRGFARAQLGQSDAARADLDKALSQDWLADWQMESLKRIAAEMQRETSVSAQSAPVLFCTYDSQNVLCSLLPRGSNPAGSEPGPGYEAAARTYEAFKRNDFNAAASAASQAVQAAPDNLAYRMLLVNALVSAGRQEEARAAFEPVRQRRDVPPGEWLDVGYAAQRLAYKTDARNAFASAIDASGAGQIELDAQARQNVRQAISDFDRTWGFIGAFGYGTVGVMNPAFAPSFGARHTLQSSQELYWRPPMIDNTGSSGFEVYARMNQALYDGTGGATGLPTNQGALGARWKPFASQNFVFAAERFVPIGRNSRTDWLLRGAWSGGEGGGLRVDRADWPYWQIYVEGDRFIQHPQTLGTLEARYGRAYAAGHNLVAMPYLAFSAGYDSLLYRRTTVSIGPGVAMRWSFREDTHHAPQSCVELNLQYRVRVAGDDRSSGLVATLYFSY